MSIKNHVPNFITSINLACGVLAIISFSQCGHSEFARLSTIAILIAISLLADFLDGLSARILNAKSNIGEQLDSLADMVSFGVVPALVAYHFLMLASVNSELPLAEYLPYTAILIPVFSALRLAKFNIEGGDYDYFRGLATPANCIFYIGLIFVDNTSLEFLLQPYFLLPSIVILCGLMVSNLPMFDLKVTSMAWKGNEVRYIFIVVVIALLAIFQLSGITLCIIAYIFASLVNKMFNK